VIFSPPGLRARSAATVTVSAAGGLAVALNCGSSG
jgi:hypothetical protein